MAYMNSFIVLIGGGSASGKTTIASRLQTELSPHAVVIPIDNYYKDLSHIPMRERLKTNFDHPDAIEIELLMYHLSQLQHHIPIETPVYDFATHTRCHESIIIEPKDIVILEGLHALTFEQLRDISSLKIFVDLDDDLRIIRRIQRDISERGRKINHIIKQYLSTVRPMYKQFIEPSKKFADIIVLGDQLEIAIKNILLHPYLQKFHTGK
ncbi:MAG: uridine kinase [Candidatus Hydrogenedens sp.]|nr:uridine kinase [Candidatus Hydrogenedens sp.]